MSEAHSAKQMRLALEPERLEKPTVTAREDPQDGADSIKTLKLFVVSDVGRRSTLLSSIRSVRSWQPFLPRSVVPSLASCLWQRERRRIVRRGLTCSKPRGRTLKQVLQIVIAVSVEPPDQDGSSCTSTMNSCVLYDSSSVPVDDLNLAQALHAAS